MYTETLEDILLLLVDEYPDPIEEKRLAYLVYLVDRASVNKSGHQITSCEYTKYMKGPHSRTIDDAIETLTESDLLYKDEEVIDGVIYRNISIDYRSKADERISQISDEVREVVSTVCSSVHRLERASLREKIHSFPEVETTQKYGRIQVADVESETTARLKS